jgi:elongation factor P
MMLRFFLSLSLLASASAFAPVPAFSRAPSALGVAIDTSDIKNGMTIELDGEPYKVLSFSIMKQARGAAKTTIKFKNLMKGNTLENTYRSGEKFETAMIEKALHQYTYVDGVSEHEESFWNLYGNKLDSHSFLFLSLTGNTHTFG